MIAEARSLVLALVALPAVVGFGKLPGLGTEGADRDQEFKPDLSHLELPHSRPDEEGNMITYDPCSNLEGDRKKAHDQAFGEMKFVGLPTGPKWCGSQKTKEGCGDLSLGSNFFPTTFLLGEEALTTQYGRARYYTICAWDENFEYNAAWGKPDGKCRATGWSYTCPAEADKDPRTGEDLPEVKPGCAAPVGHAKAIRSNKIRLSTRDESCSMKMKGSKLYLTQADRPAKYYPVETCTHKLIEDERRRLTHDEADHPGFEDRRRLDSPVCPTVPTGIVKHDMDDGSICCDTTSAAGTVQLVEDYTEEVREDKWHNYAETCTYEEGKCNCQVVPFTTGNSEPECPPGSIKPFPWWAN